MMNERPNFTNCCKNTTLYQSHGRQSRQPTDPFTRNSALCDKTLATRPDSFPNIVPHFQTPTLLVGSFSGRPVVTNVSSHRTPHPAACRIPSHATSRLTSHPVVRRIPYHVASCRTPHPVALRILSHTASRRMLHPVSPQFMPSEFYRALCSALPLSLALNSPSSIWIFLS